MRPAEGGVKADQRDKNALTIASHSASSDSRHTGCDARRYQ